MPDGKIKTYKHPDREKVVQYKPYVPQYQIHGVDPKVIQSGVVSGNIKIASPLPLSSDNPRSKRSAIRQPYATVGSPSPLGNGPVPNVGNNMEHTWSSVDGDIIDDISYDIDENHNLIDNNDTVSNEALGYQSGLTANDIDPQEQKTFMLEEDLSSLSKDNQDNTDKLLPVIVDLVDNSYLLIVSGVAICSGPLEEIQDQARALVFGEHELCDGNPISVDDIIILKKIRIKVGLFLE